MESTQQEPEQSAPAPESDARTNAQKESDARTIAEKVLFLQKEEERAKPMMRVVAYDETDQKEPKSNPAKVARLKKLYGF